jgi:hypothetical protein
MSRRNPFLDATDSPSIRRPDLIAADQRSASSGSAPRPAPEAARIHALKTWPAFFAEVRAGRKRFEIRRNDRGFAVGDCLVLQEWNPDTKTYTREAASMRVTYLVQGEWGLPGDVCVMSIEPWASPPPTPAPATTPEIAKPKSPPHIECCKAMDYGTEDACDCGRRLDPIIAAANRREALALARAEKAEAALREVVRRAGLPITPNVSGMPDTAEVLVAAIAKCARLVAEHVAEPALALSSPPSAPTPSKDAPHGDER